MAYLIYDSSKTVILDTDNINKLMNITKKDAVELIVGRYKVNIEKISAFDKWKNICLTADNVASEVLNCEEAREELSIEELKMLIEYFGDDEYVEVQSNGTFKLK